MNLQDKLHQGIAAAKAGKKEEARRLLLEVVETDQKQLQGWLWLGYVVDDLDDKEICFENVLVLDPRHQHAQKGLIWVKEKQAETARPPKVTTSQDREPAPGTPSAQDIMSREAAIAAGYLIEDEFDNKWLCPYCTALTRDDDDACPNCQRALVLKKRLSPERSVWLWRGFFLQIYTAFYTLVAGLGYFTAMTKWQGIPNPLLFWPLYFGLPLDQPSNQIALALQTLPLPIFWALVAVALYSLSLMLMLYLRIPFGHLLYLFNSALMFLLAIVGLIFSTLTTIRCLAGLGLALGIGQLVITFNLWKDFTFQQTRLHLKLDRDAKTHRALYESARKYGNLKMWGNAALHLRRAVARQPNNLSYRLALVVAYINIKRYELAQQNLDDAEQFSPNAPQIKELRRRLADLASKIE